MGTTVRDVAQLPAREPTVIATSGQQWTHSVQKAARPPLTPLVQSKTEKRRRPEVAHGAHASLHGLRAQSRSPTRIYCLPGGRAAPCVRWAWRSILRRPRPAAAQPSFVSPCPRSFVRARLALRSVTRTVKPSHQACQRAGFPELSPRRFVTAPGIVRATAPGVPVAAGTRVSSCVFSRWHSGIDSCIF